MSAKPRRHRTGVRRNIPQIHLVMIVAVAALLVIMLLLYQFAPQSKESLYIGSIGTLVGLLAGKLSNGFGKPFVEQAEEETEEEAEDGQAEPKDKA